MPETKISDIIKAALGNIRETADANTIIGDPITTANGTTILPVSKVTVGVATGGLDYNSKNDAANKNANFGGGGGTGLSVTPVAFLVVKPEGDIELLNVNDPTNSGDSISALVGLIGKAPNLLSKVKSAFSKKKKDEDLADAIDDLDDKIDDAVEDLQDAVDEIED